MHNISVSVHTLSTLSGLAKLSKRAPEKGDAVSQEGRLRVAEVASVSLA